MSAAQSRLSVRGGAVVAGIALTAAACGTSPSVSAGSGPRNTEAVASAEGVYAKVESLSGQARTDYLLDEAKKEGNELTLYSSYSDESLKVLVDQFQKKYGIKVESVRSTPEAINQRIAQESQASSAKGNDLVESRGFEMYRLNAQGLIRSLRGDFLRDVPESGRFDGWTADRFNIILPSWNTTMIAANEQPRTWQELADPKWKGKLAIEKLDDNWYQTLHGWLMQQGWSQQQTDEYFSKLAANSRVVTGHTQMAQFLAAGQFAVAVDSYSYLTEGQTAKGAPVAYQPAVSPAVSQPNGIGLMKSAAHPAAAALLYEWILTEGQAFLQRTGNTAATMVPKDVPMIPLDVSGYDKDQANWAKRYDDLLRSGG